MTGSRWAAWTRDQSGSLGTTFAFLVPLIGISAIGALDLTSMVTARTRLQQATDAAALAIASQARVATVDPATAQALATKIVSQMVAASAADVTVTADVSDGKSYKVNARQKLASVSGKLIGSPFDTTAAKSSAVLTGTAKICVTALDTASVSMQVLVEKMGSLTGNGCGVIANSKAADAITIEKKSTLTASVIATPGGVSGSTSPVAVTRAPVFQNPMANIAEPAMPTSCTQTADVSIKDSTTTTLTKGFYCGAVSISGSATVTLSSGTYYFAKGLNVSGSATLKGDDVVLVFGPPPGGSTAWNGISMKGNPTIDLGGGSASSVAPGFLIWQHSTLASNGSATFELDSPNIKKLTGVIYIPNFMLTVTNSGPSDITVVDMSPWTALVVKALSVSKKSNVVLNSNYSSAPNVPVPGALTAPGYLGTPTLSQ